MPNEGITPAFIALVVCDNIYQEPGGKTALVGLFNRITAKSFPYKHARLAVFVSVTDIRPGTIATLDIVHGETDETVVEAKGKFPDEVGPITVVDMNFILNELVFPKPGTYFVRFFGGDRPLAMRPFEVEQEQSKPPRVTQ